MPPPFNSIGWGAHKTCLQMGGGGAHGFHGPVLLIWRRTPRRLDKQALAIQCQGTEDHFATLPMRKSGQESWDAVRSESSVMEKPSE